MDGRRDRIVRVLMDGQALWGVLDDRVVVHLPEGPYDGRAPTGDELGELGELVLLAPAAPSKVICVARNFAAHAAEHAAPVPETPLLFLKPPSAVIGHGAAIELPSESRRVEHEGELALFIGRRCRRVSTTEAWAVVLGVSCANDVTARDLQRAEKLWTRGKGFDTFCPVGPWIVTGMHQDGVVDLEIRCSVNGELRQQGRVDQMVFPPEVLVSYASQVMTLEPGDLILTGTPAGVGALEPGDEVTVEIDEVGRLANPVRIEPR